MEWGEQQWKVFYSREKSLSEEINPLKVAEKIAVMFEQQQRENLKSIQFLLHFFLVRMWELLCESQQCARSKSHNQGENRWKFLESFQLPRQWAVSCTFSSRFFLLAADAHCLSFLSSQFFLIPTFLLLIPSSSSLLLLLHTRKNLSPAMSFFLHSFFFHRAKLTLLQALALAHSDSNQHHLEWTERRKNASLKSKQ